MAVTLNRPQPGEYPDYYQTYMDQLPEGDLLDLLESQAMELQRLLQGMDDQRAEVAYAEGKWTIKELLQHLLDSERVFAYRALCISRREEASLPGYDENKYAINSKANHRLLSDMLEEYEHVRRSSILLIRSFTPDMLDNRGTANRRAVSLMSVIYIMAAHEVHHMNILQERYLQLKK